MRKIYIALLLSATFYSVSVPAASIAYLMTAYENLLSSQETRDNAQQAVYSAQYSVYAAQQDIDDKIWWACNPIVACPAAVGEPCPQPQLPSWCYSYPYNPPSSLIEQETLILNLRIAELDDANEQLIIAEADLLIAQSIYEWYANLYDDSDGDNIYDVIDNCPSISNSNQVDLDNNGTGYVCDDADQDNIINSIDNCPANPNSNQLDTDQDGLGDTCDTTPNGDTDGDGIDELTDNCPTTSNVDQNDWDADGVGDVCDSTPNGDTDSDGIDELVDNCLTVANPTQSDLDQDSIGDACDRDIDGDGVFNTLETAYGTDPYDPSDADEAEMKALEASELEEIQIPAMGGIGLLALGLAMLGLGAVRLRKK